MSLIVRTSVVNQQQLDPTKIAFSMRAPRNTCKDILHTGTRMMSKRKMKKT
jgi:hypothetical protein